MARDSTTAVLLQLVQSAIAEDRITGLQTITDTLLSSRPILSFSIETASAEVTISFKTEYLATKVYNQVALLHKQASFEKRRGGKNDKRTP
jgi:hypothetical protein